MSSFVKLFGSILDSSIWQEPDATRLVWITMLAMADRDGVVEASVPGLAARARQTLADTEAALATLSSPDRYSRTEDHEGRRVEKVPGGWRLLNYDQYRARASREAQLERNAERQRRYRERHAASRGVTVTQNDPIAEAEAEAEADHLLLSSTKAPSRACARGVVLEAEDGIGRSWREPLPDPPPDLEDPEPSYRHALRVIVVFERAWQAQHGATLGLGTQDYGRALAVYRWATELDAERWEQAIEQSARNAAEHIDPRRARSPFAVWSRQPGRFLRRSTLGAREAAE